MKEKKEKKENKEKKEKTEKEMWRKEKSLHYTTEVVVTIRSTQVIRNMDRGSHPICHCSEVHVRDHKYPASGGKLNR